VIPQAGCSCFYQAPGQIVQLITVYLNGAVPEETGKDSTAVFKVVAPTQPSDYRPISITPIVTRVMVLMERMVVTLYIHPSLLALPDALTFTNQFAFRPTGSNTAAIIIILDPVTRLLVDNLYVIVIAIDFTKAFVTTTLVEKLALLNIPDNVLYVTGSVTSLRKGYSVQYSKVTHQSVKKLQLASSRIQQSALCRMS
jgi:hypothetical protein